MFFPGLEAKPKLIVDGEHTAVVSHANGVIAATLKAGHIVVHTYSQLTETWFNEELIRGNGFLYAYKTLALMQRILFVCLHQQNKCYRFSLADKRLYEYDLLSVNGTLSFPLMCDSDKDRNVLIVVEE